MGSQQYSWSYQVWIREDNKYPLPTSPHEMMGGSVDDDGTYDDARMPNGSHRHITPCRGIVPSGLRQDDEDRQLSVHISPFLTVWCS